MPDQVVTVRPTGGHSRLPLVLKTPNDRRVYFQAGGFVVADDRVTVRTRWGDEISAGRSEITAVCLTFVPGRGGGDFRVLLTDSSNAVLAQDTGIFYTDLALRTLAAAIPCGFRDERFPDLDSLQEAHDGVFEHRWEAHPIRAALFAVLIAVVVVAAALAIVASLR